MGKICPRVLSTGTCPDPLCVKRHDVYPCQDCGVISMSQQEHRIHLSNRRHINKVQGLGMPYHCPVCDVDVSGSRCWSQHVRGRQHLAKCEANQVVANVAPEEVTSRVGHHYCALCKVVVPNHVWTRHQTSTGHNHRIRFAKFEAAFEEAAKDKHGVVVSHHPGGLDFGIIEVAAAQRGVMLPLSVKSTVPSSRVHLVEVKIISSLQTSSPSVLFLHPFDFRAILTS